MSTNAGVVMARANRTKWPDTIKTMLKKAILKQISKGNRGANSNLAATYKLLVSVHG